ncbi:hypothetical protein SO3561_05964 [Streptomyces olivochromogenes]|uniref:Uncharacterized protein n=3 Tax=Streptomyces TaxID=1883 RepID=A0A250VJM7_STROL|nr:hypothetical protein SO3561_05964 [Streptomyces olivochromogenes]
MGGGDEMGHEELLTADVEARVLAEADRWLRAGLSTEPCDRPRAEASVAAVYRAHGLPVPRTVVWMDSPLGGAPASWVLRHGREDRLDGTLFTDLAAGPPLRLSPEFARRAEERMRDQLPAAGDGRPPAGRARRPLTGTFWDTSEARTRLVRALGEPLYDTLGLHWERGESGAYELEEEMSRVLSRSTDPAPGRFGGLVRRRLQDRLRGPVPGHIVRPVRVMDVITPPPPPSREEIYFRQEFGGRLDSWSAAGELIHWRSMLAAAGLPGSPALEALQEALYQVGAWWPLEDAVVLTERPVVLLHQDGTDTTAPHVRIGYADGWQVEDV